MLRVLDWLFTGTWYELYLRWYGLIAFSHILFEYVLAISYTRRAARQFDQLTAEEDSGKRRRPYEAIAALVPAFQEGMKSLEFCLEGLLHQDYRGPLLAVIVDDGSYLKDIARYEEFVANPPKVRMAWWRVVALVIPLIKRIKRLHVTPEDYQKTLDDLRKRRAETLEMCERYAENHPHRFKFIASAENQGKRRAHKAAHDWVLANFDSWVRGHYPQWVVNEYPSVDVRRRTRIGVFAYLTVDSDTKLNDDATTNMVRALIASKAGAATGYVAIRNGHVNWLARLVEWRYWSAFYVERAAQSRLKSVMCCSGPLSIYRASILDDPKLRLMDLYISQTFLGVLCTFGDDRRMTYLILRAGYKVIFVPEAVCWTYAPETVRDYVKQQTRWNMSFYRELILSLREIFVWNVYMTYEMLMQFLLPFALMGGIGITLWLAIFRGEWGLVGQYVITVVGIGLFRSVYGAWKRKEPAYLLFALYGFLYLLLLLVRGRAIYKLFVQNDTRWQTRKAVSS